MTEYVKRLCHRCGKEVELSEKQVEMLEKSSIEPVFTCIVCFDLGFVREKYPALQEVSDEIVVHRCLMLVLGQNMDVKSFENPVERGGVVS